MVARAATAAGANVWQARNFHKLLEIYTIISRRVSLNEKVTTALVRLRITGTGQN